MYLKELEYLEALEQRRNFSKAAEDLFISQPALSKYISGLESEIGEKMYFRSGKDLIPTEIGSLYLAFAKETLTRQREMEKEVEMLKSIRRIRVGIPANLSTILVDPICRFRKRHPTVRVELYEEDYEKTEMALDNGQLDIAFAGEPSERKAIITKKIMEEEVFLIVPKQLIPAKAEELDGCTFVDVHALDSCPFLIPVENTEFTRTIGRLFRKMEFEPAERFYTRNHNLAIYLAARGYGVGMAAIPPKHSIPVWLHNIDERAAPVRKCRFTREPVKLSCYVLYSADRDPLIEEFVDLAKCL